MELYSGIKIIQLVIAKNADAFNSKCLLLQLLAWPVHSDLQVEALAHTVLTFTNIYRATTHHHH